MISKDNYLKNNIINSTIYNTLKENANNDDMAILDRLKLIISDDDSKDELYNAALEIVKSEGNASTSFLQRKLQIGYNRAARIIDQMEINGEVSKANHVGKREVLK